MTSSERSIQIVLVEDNWIEAEDTKLDLLEAFPSANVRVFSTAKEFLDRLDDFRRNPADVYILDMMVTFMHPSREQLPVETEKIDFFKCGAYLLKKLAEIGLKDRAIIYSVTDKDDLRSNDMNDVIDYHVQKLDDPSGLISKTREVLKRSR